jgi:hypothetical protein
MNKITDKQQQMMNRVYELARKEIETPTPLPGIRAPQWNDANLVAHAFQVAVSEMQQELILSDPAKVQELKEREENATEAWDAHEEEAKRLGVEFYNCGWSSGDCGDWFVIASKTSHGRYSTSRHAKTGEIEHVWHDVE